MEGLKLAIERAQQQAKDVLGRHQEMFTDSGLDIKGLANLEGVAVIEEDFDDEKIAGFIQMKTKDGKPLIVVNKKNPEERKRFTIAHELGHFFLHNSQSVHIDDLDTAEMVLFRNEASSQATHIREIEANQFAAQLLMPRESILRDVLTLRKGNLGMSEIVSNLAEKYSVSQSAMAIRLNKFI